MERDKGGAAMNPCHVEGCFHQRISQLELPFTGQYGPFVDANSELGIREL